MLRYITALPDTHKYGGRLEVDGSTVEHGGGGYGVRGAVNVPIIADQLALRVSASTRQDPGYIDDVANGSKDVNRSYVSNGHIALLWTPNDRLTVKLNAFIQERDGHGSSREDYNFVKKAPVYGDLKNSRVPGEYDSERQQIYNIAADLNLGWGTFSSSTSYAVNHYTSISDLTSLFGPIFQPAFGIPDFGVNLNQRFSTDKFTQEFKLAGEYGGNIDWQGGFFYTHERSNFYQKFMSIQTENDAPLLGLPPLADSIGVSQYNEVAGFGDVTYHFTPKFSFQAGVRYSYNYQTSLNYSHAGILGDASLGQGTSHEGVPTFVVAPEYKFSEDTTVYGRIASGYRAGGPNFTLAGNQTPYRSDSTVNYELGVKSFLLDRMAYVELDAFYIDWSRIQLLGTNALDEEFFSNAGGAVSRGFEFSGQYHPVKGLTLSGNLTYDDAHLTDPAPPGIAGRSGDRLPYSPRLAGQVSADYSFPLFADWKGVVGADYSYIGDRASDFQPSFSVPRIRLPAYDVTDLRAGINNGRYSIDVFAKNVFDKQGFQAANPLTLSKIGNYAVAVIQPLTLGFSIAAKF